MQALASVCPAIKNNLGIVLLALALAFIFYSA
jgi:hypothetical protein